MVAPPLEQQKTISIYFGGVYHLFVHSVFCGCHGWPYDQLTGSETSVKSMWHSAQNLPSLRVEIPWQQAAHGCPHLWCALPLATDVEPSVSCKHQARFQLIHWCSRRRRHQDPNFQTSYVIVLLQRLLHEDDNWLEVDSLRISFTLVEVVTPKQPLVQSAAWAFCPWASFGEHFSAQAASLLASSKGYTHILKVFHFTSKFLPDSFTKLSRLLHLLFKRLLLQSCHIARNLRLPSINTCLYLLGAGRSASQAKTPANINMLGTW